MTTKFGRKGFDDRRVLIRQVSRRHRAKHSVVHRIYQVADGTDMVSGEVRVGQALKVGVKALAGSALLRADIYSKALLLTEREQRNILTAAESLCAM